MSTLPMKFGVRNIALLGSGILLTNFIAGISAASYMHYAFNLPVIILTQFIFASSLIFQVSSQSSCSFIIICCCLLISLITCMNILFRRGCFIKRNIPRYLFLINKLIRFRMDKTISFSSHCFFFFL